MTSIIDNHINKGVRHELPNDYGLNDVGEERYADINYKKLPKFKSVYKLMKFLNN